MAEHTMPAFLGAGHAGVLIFFCLSGFLLASPFAGSPERIRQPGFPVSFGARRLRRILPMYYLYLFLAYGLSLRMGHFLLHALFIEGRGHLWTVPQAMLFYLIFPLVPLAHLLIARKRLLPQIVLVIAGLLFYEGAVSTREIYLFGMLDRRLPFLFPTFMLGVLMAYIRQLAVAPQGQKALPASGPFMYLCNVALLGAMLSFILFSNARLQGEPGLVLSTHHQFSFSVAAALLVFLACLLEKGPAYRLLAHPAMVSLGIVSYSAYLLHPLLQHFVKLADLGPRGTFLALLPLTYLASCMTYRYVERPFLGPSRRVFDQETPEKGTGHSTGIPVSSEADK